MSGKESKSRRKEESELKHFAHRKTRCATLDGENRKTDRRSLNAQGGDRCFDLAYPTTATENRRRVRWLVWRVIRPIYKQQKQSSPIYSHSHIPSQSTQTRSVSPNTTMARAVCGTACLFLPLTTLRILRHSAYTGFLQSSSPNSHPV